MVLKEYAEEGHDVLFECFVCKKPCGTTYKLARHLESHEMTEERKRFKLCINGEYSCKMHDIKWEFNTNRELQVHYHIWHYKEDAGVLQNYGIPKDLVTGMFGRRIGKKLR